MSLYGIEIDLDNHNSSHTQIVELVGEARAVLDLGCWTGDLGRVLTAGGSIVTGVEVDPEAADVAKQHLHEVVVADLDHTVLTDLFPSSRFDVVVLGDVLEHLMDPVRVLTEVAGLLNPGGHVVIALPNVTHGSVRLALLQGRWRYTETGLLGRTQIRFFDRRGLAHLLGSSGFVAAELRGTIADPLTVDVDLAPDDLPPTLVEWVRHQDDAMVYQFVVRAHPGATTSNAALPPLEPVVDEDTVRLPDLYHQQAVEQDDLRHRLLTLRDHVVGLEASAASARKDQELARKEVARLTRRLSAKVDSVARLRGRVAQLERRISVASSNPAPERPPTTLARVRRRVRSSWSRRSDG